MTMKSIHTKLIPMTLAAGMVVAPMLAFAQADGTPGNPPSTVTGRAIDRATGNPTAPDGTPGNPPGTAAGRAVDRATGQVTNRDGTATNPPGTMSERAAQANPSAPGTATTNPTARSSTLAVTSARW
jgi:hypothetical protein